ncbi:winged helix-turn-helix domain-containing tetratricopeptide repeat protein [Bradyrhizobium australafricanum]|uniref:winged helix-turn-helix domain-containing tetratricopeptide repeat protein n=1 Tax=Bradyrhizobium australafricanum TaxID=2821406 RepID=UPI001CE37701|nr:winged helix-turn-helix domain-containing tetratricopeptide repeat protein [Bradyrhizobium australafricanum]MCA6096847.1 winged helix-turn-helix domain-containing protein [Bradyrhizobium australafricanum]
MTYYFNDFTLDSERRELRRGDALVAVEPQVFDLLEFLIRARDRVVSRDEVLAAVWHGRIVSEATLSSRVNAARTAIGDNGEEQRLIRTLPRKGLRFVGDVREDTAHDRPVADNASPPRPSEGPSIAVLPFTNMSGDPEQDYFADGIAEDITTALARCSRLTVIARNSAFTYKGKAVDIRQVGRDLGVGYVLEGSVRRGGDRLRITGQLIDAVSGAHLWADRFDGAATDVFDLQDRITENVVGAIEPTLLVAEAERVRAAPPDRLDAYDLLLRAYSLRYEFTPESIEAALDCLDQALALDPAYAPALAASAYCHAMRHVQGWVKPNDAYRERAVAQAWRAVELAPGDPQVLWMAAFAIWNMADEIEPARDLFERSLAINPNSAMALVLGGWIEAMRGNQKAGRAMIERAQRLNPRDPRGWFAAAALAICAVLDQNFAEAVMWADKALAQNRRFAVALRVLIVALVKTGDTARAAQIARELLKVDPEFTISGFLSRIPFPVEAMSATYRETLKAAGVPD